MNKREKIKEFINKHYAILIPISLIIILFLAFAIYNIHRLYVNHTTDYTTSFYQYFAGRKVEYEGTLKINRKNNIVDLDTGKQKIELTSIPVYYQEDKIKVLFPESMTIIRPLSGYKQERTTDFATITWDEDNTEYLLKSNEYDAEITNSFLYDGVDLYFFLTETNIKIGNDEIILSPMSYIRVNVGNSLEYYDRESDTYKIMEITNEQVIATNKDFEVNLSSDKVTNYDDIILLMGPSYLNEIK